MWLACLPARLLKSWQSVRGCNSYRAIANNKLENCAIVPEWVQRDFFYIWQSLSSGSQIDVRLPGRSIPVREFPFELRDSCGDAVAPTLSFIKLI